MHFTSINPSKFGKTIVIDNGIPFKIFESYIDEYLQYIDFIKFGWGSPIVMPSFKRKLDLLKSNNLDFFIGGTLFEKCFIENRIEDYKNFLSSLNFEYVEISNGTIPLSNEDKCKQISDFSNQFNVISEVGFKNCKKSLELSPAKWNSYINNDISAGAKFVIAEARENGSSGICRENGELRLGLINEILETNQYLEKIIWETPNKNLQVSLLLRIGAKVHLCNIPFEEIIPLYTLRCKLRSDTLLSNI